MASTSTDKKIEHLSTRIEEVEANASRICQEGKEDPGDGEKLDILHKKHNDELAKEKRQQRLWRAKSLNWKRERKELELKRRRKPPEKEAEKEAEVKHEEKVVNQLNATKAKAVEEEDEDSSSSCIVRWN